MSGYLVSTKSLYVLSVKVRTGIKKRFLARVKKTDSCWLWIGCRDKFGYAIFWHKYGFSKRAQRVSYELFNGRIRGGFVIDHLCRNHSCVNPKHLDAVTIRTNTLRGVGPAARQARQTHCKRGHKFTKENTYVWPKRRGRACRECNKFKLRRIALNKKEDSHGT